VAAARLGEDVTFVGAVGAGDFGDAALADLAAEDVGVSRCSRLEDAATGAALIVVDERGENQITVAPGANARVDGAFVEAALAGFEPPAGGVFLVNFEIGDEALLAGARFAAAHGMRVVVNPAPAREIPAELLSLAPILLPNEHEAHALTTEREPAVAARVLAEWTGAPVIVTLGADGALLVHADGVAHLPAPAVEVVDTTGAGDCFAGALAAGLAAGQELLEAARDAVHAASQSVTAAGARAGMPYRHNLG